MAHTEAEADLSALRDRLHSEVISALRTLDPPEGCTLRVWRDYGTYVMAEHGGNDVGGELLGVYVAPPLFVEETPPQFMAHFVITGKPALSVWARPENIPVTVVWLVKALLFDALRSFDAGRR